MEQLIGQIIGTWGTFGLVLIAMGWYIYNNIKNNKSKEKSVDDITDDKFEIVDKKIDLLTQDLSDKYNDLSRDIKNIDKRVDNIEQKVAEQPNRVYNKFQDANKKKMELHAALLAGRINAGPKIHNILSIYSKLTGADHMAIGLFHNGTTTLTGIPYYKFDIVAEKFDLDNENDYELAPLYKDTDIIRHNLLPLEIMQNTMMQYEIKPGCRLQDIDAILYGRAYGIGAKHLSIGIFRDEKGVPAGFLGGANFNDNPIDMEEFDKCLLMLHQTYTEDMVKLNSLCENDNN